MKRTRFFLAMLFLAGGVSSLALAQRGYHGHFGRPTVDVQQQAKIQATEEQRAQLRTCLGVAERLLMLAADIRKPAHLSDSEWVKAHQRWNEVLQQAMQSHHQAFLKSMNEDQQAALKNYLTRMDKTWSQVSSRFEIVNRDLAAATPDARRISAHAREWEKSLKKWHKQHREMGSEIGIEG